MSGPLKNISVACSRVLWQWVVEGCPLASPLHRPAWDRDSCTVGPGGGCGGCGRMWFSYRPEPGTISLLRGPCFLPQLFGPHSLTAMKLSSEIF